MPSAPTEGFFLCLTEQFARTLCECLLNSRDVPQQPWTGHAATSNGKMQTGLQYALLSQIAQSPVRHAKRLNGFRRRLEVPHRGWGEVDRRGRKCSPQLCLGLLQF